MSLPYYKRFPRDFLDGTIGLSLEVKGAYAVVLDLIYMRGGRLPDDGRYIAGQLGCSLRKWNAIRSELLERGKLTVELGFISNFRADYLLEETRKLREKNAENGSKSKENNTQEKRTQPDTRAGLKTEPESEPDKEDIVVSEEPTLSPSPRRSYPDAFEDVWKAYPHHKGRSSKPKALAEWKRMPAQERDGLMVAIQAFSRNVDKVCGGMGAPCMARWMNHGKHLNWIEEANSTTSPSPSFVKTWNGPDRLREMVVRERGEGFAVSYIDRATWDGEAIIAHNDLAVEKLKDVRCLTGVVIKNSA